MRLAPPSNATVLLAALPLPAAPRSAPPSQASSMMSGSGPSRRCDRRMVRDFAGCLTRSHVGRVRRALSVAVACDHDEHDYQSACLLCEHSEGVPQPHVAGLRS